jgi:hypothetical protein
MVHKVLMGKPEGKSRHGKAGHVELNLDKLGVRMWTGVIRLRVSFTGELL